MPKLDDLTGKEFGSLTVIRKGNGYDGATDFRVTWICQCTCGEIEDIVARYLKRGEKKSCFKCNQKKGGKGHDGKSKYWGNNSQQIGY